MKVIYALSVILSQLVSGQNSVSLIANQIKNSQFEVLLKNNSDNDYLISLDTSITRHTAQYYLSAAEHSQLNLQILIKYFKNKKEVEKILKIESHQSENDSISSLKLLDADGFKKLVNNTLLILKKKSSISVYRFNINQQELNAFIKPFVWPNLEGHTLLLTLFYKPHYDLQLLISNENKIFKKNRELYFLKQKIESKAIKIKIL